MPIHHLLQCSIKGRGINPLTWPYEVSVSLVDKNKVQHYRTLWVGGIFEYVTLFPALSVKLLVRVDWREKKTVTFGPVLR